MDHSFQFFRLAFKVDLPDLPGPAFLHRARRHMPGVPCYFLAERPAGQMVVLTRSAGAVVFPWSISRRVLGDVLQGRREVPSISDVETRTSRSWFAS